MNTPIKSPITFIDPDVYFRSIPDGATTSGARILAPVLHRLWNSPGPSDFPDCPGSRATLDTRYNYWHGACYVLHVMFGWSRPDLGFLRLRQANGWDRSDPGMRWFLDLFDHRNRLDELAAAFWDPRLMPDYPGFYPNSRHTPNDSWWREWQQTIAKRPEHIGGPYNLQGAGGYNELHLFGVEFLSKACDDQAQWTWTGSEVALCRIRTYTSHTQTLDSAEASAYGANGMSVRLHADDIGYLGDFQYSRITKRWFQCSSALHHLGHAFFPPAGDLTYPGVEAWVTSHGLTYIPDHGPDFRFLPGEIRLSGKGSTREIIGLCRRPTGDLAYVIRDPKSGKLDSKSAHKAHAEYGKVIGLVANTPSSTAL